MLSRKLIDSELLKIVIRDHQTFNNTIYKTAPELLYEHGEVEMYQLDFEGRESSAVIHIMLTFPMIYPQVPFPIYEIRQVILFLIY